MNLNDLVPAPNAEKVNKLAKRVFGYALDLDNLSEEKAERLHNNLSSQMNIYESKLGSATCGSEIYVIHCSRSTLKASSTGAATALHTPRAFYEYSVGNVRLDVTQTPRRPFFVILREFRQH